jgi:starvation-inducible DNA-binding protein
MPKKKASSEKVETKGHPNVLKVKTLNPLPEATRTVMVEILQARLVDALDLQNQVKLAHWNVKGPNFIALHELFDELHEEMEGIVDDFAERLVILGGLVTATVQNLAKYTSLAHYPTEATASAAHVAAISQALADFAAKLHEAIEVADEVDDAVTEDLFIGHLATVDKYLWFVESHAQ